jgi:hypothetical protein
MKGLAPCSSWSQHPGRNHKNGSLAVLKISGK